MWLKLKRRIKELEQENEQLHKLSESLQLENNDLVDLLSDALEDKEKSPDIAEGDMEVILAMTYYVDKKGSMGIILGFDKANEATALSLSQLLKAIDTGAISVKTKDYLLGLQTEEAAKLVDTVIKLYPLDTDGPMIPPVDLLKSHFLQGEH